MLLILILNRLKNQLDLYLSDKQAGFMKERGTKRQILVLRLLTEKVKRQGNKIYNCFIDFQKPFDTTKHKIIWSVLKSYAVEIKIIILLKNIYEETESAVRIGNDDYGE